MLLRPAASRGPRPAPLLVSLIVHLSVIAWVFNPSPGHKKPESLYQREIAPHEKKLVWYRFNKQLPEVSPMKPAAKEASRPKPVRATVKYPKQSIAAKSPRPDAATQMTLAPGPELKIERELEAPNLMAFKMPEPPAPPQQPKLFAPPPETPHPITTPELENAPEIAAQLPAPPTEIPVPRPPPKQFNPPVEVAKRVETPQLQPGEAVVTPANPAKPDLDVLASLPKPARPVPKAFAPPPEVARQARAPAALSAGPALAPQVPKAAPADTIAGLVPQPARPQPKLFVPPSPRRPARTSESGSPVLDIPPTLASNLNVAVVGLNPSDRMPVIPEGSRPAQFSAAPEISLKGGDAEPVKSANIVMSDLTIRGDAPKAGTPQQRESIAKLTRVQPTSIENLLATRPATTRSVPMGALPLTALRVPAAPDPRLDGRVVYTVAIQMPNVTSYSGSWILWYAERKSASSDEREVLPPEPLRKVDPIYDNSAVEDRVEGKVQLSAIIHTDGYVYGINVVKGLDPRLDKSATDALRKWEFIPARRDGNPVDVDIVIEIPFRLRPLK
jgi:TonB family protein